MYHPTQLLFLVAAFLVPHSQAIISNQVEASMDTAGYYCRSANASTRIRIHYADQASHLLCEVTLQHNQQAVVSLLEAKRNTRICEDKAELMKQRLVDRGWHCLSSGIN